MSNPNSGSAADRSPQQVSGSIKMLHSLKEELLKIELSSFIKLVSATRKLQKKYYTCQDKAEKQKLLIACKQKEVIVEREGNRLWVEYKLGQYVYAPGIIAGK